MRADIIETPGLGDRSYVVSDGSASVVADPQRDLDRVEAILAERGAPVSHVQPLTCAFTGKSISHK